MGKLNIADGINSLDTVTVRSPGSSAAVLQIYPGTANYNSEIDFDGTGSDKLSYSNGGSMFQFYISSTNICRIDSAGLIHSGNITAYGSPSDLNLKENIEVIPDALEKIQKLEGITFNYKKDGGKSTGLIAQQLQEVLPEVVYTTTDIDTEEEHLAVRYGNVVGLLVEGIKEQQEQIEELKSIINTLVESK